MDAAALLSSILGFTYFIAWSLSFYPQPLLNLHRRSTQGTTIAYPLLNILGFSAYTIYTAVFLFSPVIRRQYALRHPNNPVPSISPWDLAFAAHGTFFVALTLSQFWGRTIWRWTETTEEQERETRKAGGVVWGLFGAGVLGVLGMMAIVFFASDKGGRDARGWAYIDIIYAFSNLKLFVTVSKYVPQVILNARLRSTAGWSIYQVLCDFTGGVTSFMQLFLDAYRLSDLGSGRKGWKDGVQGNIAKFWLANLSIGFDIVFIVQHYCLYRGGDKASKVADSDETPPASVVATRDEELDNDERRPLLGDATRS